MSAQDIWNWFIVPALAAFAICVIGIAGRNVIVGTKHPVMQFGVAFGVIIAVVVSGGFLINQAGPGHL
jgi:hypothetical protein